MIYDQKNTLFAMIYTVPAKIQGAIESFTKHNSIEKLIMQLIVLLALIAVVSAAVTEFNFVHRRSDYTAVLAVKGLPLEVKHSFALNKTLIVHQKQGGGVVTQYVDINEGKVYRSEKMNVDRMIRDSPQSFATATTTSIEVLAGIERCSLQENTEPSPLGSFEEFELTDRTELTVSYAHPQSQFKFEFSLATGQLLNANSYRVMSYVEAPLSASDFALPSACVDMLDVPNDPRSPGMKATMVGVSRYHEKTREDVLAELNAKALASGSGERKLGANEDSWLNLRIPGTKWCGKNNDYNCGVNQDPSTPTVGSPFNCAVPPIAGTNCGKTLYATGRITADVYNLPVIAEVAWNNYSASCTGAGSGGYCVANNGVSYLTELDKACRQHDLCPYSSGSTMSCACDKTIRDRAHAVAVQYGSSTETNIVETVFAGNNAAWTCNNFERECGTTSGGWCNWDQWIWNWQGFGKYKPDLCGTSTWGCSSSIDEDGRLWGKVGKYSTATCQN